MTFPKQISSGAKRHKGKVTAASIIVALGSIYGVMQMFGLRITAGEPHTTASPPPTETPADGEAEKPTPTRERVRQLEERTAKVEGAVGEMSGHVSTLATQQAVMQERVGSLSTQVQQFNSDTARRYDSLATKIDTLSGAVLAPRR